MCLTNKKHRVCTTTLSIVTYCSVLRSNELGYPIHRISLSDILGVIFVSLKKGSGEVGVAEIMSKAFVLHVADPSLIPDSTYGLLYTTWTDP